MLKNPACFPYLGTFAEQVTALGSVRRMLGREKLVHALCDVPLELLGSGGGVSWRHFGGSSHVLFARLQPCDLDTSACNISQREPQALMDVQISIATSWSAILKIMLL